MWIWVRRRPEESAREGKIGITGAIVLFSRNFCCPQVVFHLTWPPCWGSISGEGWAAPATASARRWVAVAAWLWAASWGTSHPRLLWSFKSKYLTFSQKNLKPTISDLQNVSSSSWNSVHWNCIFHKMNYSSEKFLPLLLFRHFLSCGTQLHRQQQ